MRREALPLLSVPGFPRVEDYAGVWAIEEARGAALWELARRTDLLAHVAAAAPPSLAAASEYQTLRAPNGESVAVIPIGGTLMKSASSMSSSTSTVAARRAVRKAAADPDVAAILLAIDSPGGTVSGTADLGAEVKAAAKSKPVWAFAEDLCASAAYWVASQADRVYANDPTALVGSIGTLAVVYDLSGAAEKEGVKALVFGTGPLKGAGAPGSPITEDQQAYFRGLVEDAQKSFDAAVRRGRGLTEKQIESVKTGGVFGATEALSLKLIDGIQSFDKTLAELAAEARRSQRSNRAAQSPPPDRSSAVADTTTETTTPPAAVATPAQTPDPVAAFNATVAANLERVAGIQRVCGPNAALAAQAVRENWSVERTELQALKASLAAGVAPGNPHAGPTLIFRRGPNGGPALPTGVTESQAIEAGIVLSLGRKDAEKHYAPDVLQAARDHFKTIGLQQVVMLAAVANGYQARPGDRITSGNLREVLRYAFERQAGGTSTVSLPGILGNVANKELLAGYMEEDDTWREISSVKSASTFNQRTYYRMLDNMEYEEVGADGKMKHGAANQESYTADLKTYAKMFAFTRRDLINDDLGAFDDLRNRLGRGGKKKFNNLFWTQMLAGHSTFFTTGRGNYITGSTTTLLTDGVGLGLALKAFRQMKSPSTAGSADDGGKRVNARPSLLLVPPELEAAADQLFMGEKLNVGSGPGETNTYRNKYRPVVNAWLSDTAFTGYSTTAWYLFRSATDMPMMVVSFLNGNETPIVEDTDADFDTLGIQFRGYHDFYANQAEYLCGVKSKGAA